MQRYLDRNEQVEYLKERGLRVTKNTLQKLATTGGGPEYQIFGNKAVSTPEALDAWVDITIGAMPRHAG